jgi:sugar transferase (PEP-CTERM system associated)
MSTWSINNVIRTPLLLLAGVESLILASSVYVAGILVFGNLAECEKMLGPLAPRAVIGASVVLVCLIAMGLYQLDRRIYFRETAARVIVGIVAGCLVIAAIFYATPLVMVSPEIAAVALAYVLVLLVLVRYYFVRTVDENAFRRRTLIYGAGERAASISDLRRRADRRGFRVVGKVAPPGDTIFGDKTTMTTNGKSVTDFALEMHADEIVVAMDDRRGNLPIRDLLDARVRGINVIDLMEFLERETGKIRVDLVNPGWLIFSSGFRTSRFRSFNKRFVDVLASVTLLLVSWPIILIIAAAIKIEDGIRAPIFYRQCRVGRSDKPFSIIKFRSMSEQAEADGQAVWAAEDDDRITKVGRILRKCRFDELPQILNVFRGQMSLVGPRPERPEFVCKLKESIPYYSERHSVQPGITGWAQLHYAYASSEEDAIEKLQYDLYYVKNHGLALDIMTILQTVEVVLWGKGAR